jgi:hypothetical protein
MRIAELVGCLTVATDVGTGMPEGYGLRIAVGAVRLAELLGLDEQSRNDAYYVSLLALSGCTADSEGGAALLGDEISIGAETFGMDWGSGRDMLPVMLRRARAGHGPIGGVLAMMRLFGQMPMMMEHGRDSWMGAGKAFAINIIHIDRWVEGRVTEHFGQFDSLGLMQQLGVVPSPNAT